MAQKHIKIYPSGLFDINGDFTLEDIQTIEANIKASSFNPIRREFSICLNNCENIQDTILSELTHLLKRNPKFKKILVDLNHDFTETITLQKDANGHVDKYYEMHGLAHFTEFTASSRSNFYLNLLRSLSKQLANLSLPTDIKRQNYYVDEHGHWHIVSLVISSPTATLHVSQALKDNTLTSLKKITLNEGATDDFWRALEHNTHATSVHCNVYQHLGPTSETFNAAMRHNTTLQELKVTWRHAAHDYRLLWFDALADNTTLRHLNVQMHAPSTDFIAQFAEYLACNRSLAHLSIALDSPDVKSIETFNAVYASIQNMQIHHLTLRSQKLHEPDLAEFIAHNTRLVALDLRAPQPLKEDVNLVLEALQRNETLTRYNWGVTDTDPLQSVTCEVSQVLRRNRKRREEYINDMTVLLFNIARSDVLLSVPKEIWLQIFSGVALTRFEYKFHQLLATLFQNNQIRKIVHCSNIKIF